MKKQKTMIPAWIVPESGPENEFSPNGEAAIEVDVTARFFGLTLDALHQLRDGHDSTDALVIKEIMEFRHQHGQDAPFRVELVNSILEFFDVDDIDQISADAFNLARDVIVELLAKEFSEALHLEMSLDEMREVLRRNRNEPNPHICHTHDFCDTNMVLHEVFMRRGMDIANEDGHGRWGCLWNDVWIKAKAAEFWSD